MSPGPVLVGLDPARGDNAPLFLGAALARITGAPLMAVAAYRHDPITTGVRAGMAQQELRNDALAMLEALTCGTDAELLVIGGSSPSQVLHDAAVRLDATLVVVGSTATSPLGRLAPGTTAERLLQGAPCPVAVARPGLDAGWAVAAPTSSAPVDRDGA